MTNDFFANLIETQAVGTGPMVLKELVKSDHVTFEKNPEYWRGDASLIHTDLEGQRDIEPAQFVRIYLLAGTQHTPGAIPRKFVKAGQQGWAIIMSSLKSLLETGQPIVIQVEQPR